MSKVDSGDLTAQIIANEAFVRKLARRHLRPGIPFDDLMQEGLIGLMKAIETFAPERGAQFETWAWFWINDALERCIWRETQSTGLSHREYKSVRQMRAVETRLCRELKREPSEGELAIEMDLSETRVKHLLSLCQAPIPLDDLNLDHTDHPVPLRSEASQAEAAEKREFAQKFRTAMNSLKPREQFVLVKHYGLGRENEHTLHQIAVQLGISAPRVSQIEKIAVTKIRAELSQF